MSDWFAAPVVLSLRDEVNRLFPNRDKSSDGILGDASHAARVSEHNPCWTCTGKYYGIVRAEDIDIDDGDPGRDLRRMLLNALIGDPRVWYVISNGVIYSRTYGWEPRTYTGTNGHFHHVHVSFLFEGCFDTRPFFEDTKKRTTPPKISVHKAHDEFLRVVQGHVPRYSIDVLRCQRLLNARLGGDDVQADGYVGPKTLARWGDLEHKFGGTGRPRVPDRTILTRASKGMFQIVD